jgi:hypothetical protein
MLDKEQSRSADGLAAAVRKARLTPVDRSHELAPWRRANELTRCWLYWMPVSGFPIPLAQRAWLLQFLERLASTASDQFGLRREIFLQHKTVAPLMDAFLRTTREFQPLMGLSRRPGAPLPKFPSNEEMKEMVKSGTFNLDEITPDYCYWFLKKSGKKQLETFWGHGGISMIFAEPDPATTPPPLPFSAAFRQKSTVFQKVDVDGVWESAFSLNDGFQAKSKELFGAGLEQNPQYPGITFILPLLRSSDFFSQPEQESAKWFQLFDLYLHETPEDAGILLASKTDIDETLIELLGKMREEGLVYPEGK